MKYIYYAVFDYLKKKSHYDQLKKKTKIVRYISRLKQNLILGRRAKKFHLEKDAILQKFLAYCEKCDVKSFLFWGTHLGAYRDHDFIGHDCDMDFGVRNRSDLLKLKENIENSEFKLLAEYFSPADGLCELKFTYKDISFDIFYIGDDEESYFGYCFDVANRYSDNYLICNSTQYRFPAFELVPIEFRGMQCLIPSNSPEVLSAIYGEDFMIPNPNHESGSRCKRKTIYQYWEKPVFLKKY